MIARRTKRFLCCVCIKQGIHGCSAKKNLPLAYLFPSPFLPLKFAFSGVDIPRLCQGQKKYLLWQRKFEQKITGNIRRNFVFLAPPPPPFREYCSSNLAGSTTTGSTYLLPSFLDLILSGWWAFHRLFFCHFKSSSGLPEVELACDTLSKKKKKKKKRA